MNPEQPTENTEKKQPSETRFRANRANAKKSAGPKQPRSVNKAA